jgi:hypothetical protein
MVMSGTIILQCSKCHGKGTKPNGEQCLCYLFGGPIKRFYKDLWEIGEETVRE